MATGLYWHRCPFLTYLFFSFSLWILLHVDNLMAWILVACAKGQGLNSHVICVFVCDNHMNQIIGRDDCYAYSWIFLIKYFFNFFLNCIKIFYISGYAWKFAVIHQTFT